MFRKIRSIFSVTTICILITRFSSARVPFKFEGEDFGNLKNSRYSYSEFEGSPDEEYNEISDLKTTCMDVEWSDENCIVGPFLLDIDVPEPIFREVCPESEGKFPVPESTSLYVVCHRKYLTINQCSPVHRFDPEQGKCETLVQDDFGSAVEGKSFDQLLSNWIPSGSNISNSNSELRNLDIPKPESLVIPIISPPINKRSEIETPSLQLQPPSLEPHRSHSNLCELGDGGMFPHPFSCQHFIHCAHGREFIKTCPRNTVFNPQLSICDWPYNVPDCSGLAQSQLPQRRSRFVSFVTSRNNLIADSGKRGSRDAEDSSDCDEHDYFELHQQCNKFIICENGRRHVRTCPPGTNFDPVNKGCDHAGSVDCSSRITDFGTYACNVGTKYSAPHPDYCNKFIECENGKIFVKTCGDNLVYNPISEACDYKSQVECKTPVSLESDIFVNDLHSRSPRKSSSNSKCNTPDLNQNYRIVKGGLERYPHPIHCNKFVECENGRRFVKDCGPGTYYDKIKGWCGFAKDSREAIVNSCDSYAECQGSLYLEIKCPGGTFFNPGRKQCTTGQHCPYIQQTEATPNFSKNLASTTIPETIIFDTSTSSSLVIVDEPHTKDIVDYYNIPSPGTGVKIPSNSKCSTPDLDQRYRIVEKGLERYPHPIYCNKFVECENGQRFVKDCGPGTYYDRRKGWCGYKHNTREAISYACDAYLECQGSLYAEIKCAEGSSFDPQKNQCSRYYRCPYVQQTTSTYSSTTVATTPSTTTVTTTPYTTTAPVLPETTDADYDTNNGIKES